MSLLGYVIWGLVTSLYVAHVAAQERVTEDPGPDSAAAWWMFILIMATPCALSPLFVTGMIMSATPKRRPVGLGLIAGMVLPLLILFVLMRIVYAGIDLSD
jgi:hypothetical protein